MFGALKTNSTSEVVLTDSKKNSETWRDDKTVQTQLESLQLSAERWEPESQEPLAICFNPACMHTSANRPPLTQPRWGDALCSTLSSQTPGTNKAFLFSQPPSPHRTDPLCLHPHPSKGRPHSAGRNLSPPLSRSGVTDTGTERKRGRGRRRGCIQDMGQRVQPRGGSGYHSREERSSFVGEDDGQNINS